MSVVRACMVALALAFSWRGGRKSGEGLQVVVLLGPAPPNELLEAHAELAERIAVRVEAPWRC